MYSRIVINFTLIKEMFVKMQSGRPSNLTSYAKELRKNQLKEQIRILEQQLNNARRDLKLLEKRNL